MRGITEPTPCLTGSLTAAKYLVAHRYTLGHGVALDSAEFYLAGHGKQQWRASMRFISLFLAASVSACSGLPGSLGPDPGSSFIGPSGGTAYLMFCGMKLVECYKKARDVCPSGYTIFDS